MDHFLAGKMAEDFVIRDRRRCVGGSYHLGCPGMYKHLVNIICHYTVINQEFMLGVFGKDFPISFCGDQTA